MEPSLLNLNSSKEKPSQPYIPSTNESHEMYGVQDNCSFENYIRSIHNESYRIGFRYVRTFLRVILFPFVVVVSFFIGVIFGIFWEFVESFGIRLVLKSIGNFLGMFALAMSGKADYYQKKKVYYERCVERMESGGR
eukprot:c16861_g1_i1.p1 GENE.c16861_g1_i1~~c16861_g1_i1.p1  ORF type:complete len:137 (+),score=25.15 c16861_g1_i1:40-450(+)